MYNFFAYLGRMKFIERWSLMRNSYKENIMQHSCEVAQIAFALAEIGNTFFNKQYDSYKISTSALFHEISEVLTGDLPTPIKYYDDEIKKAYKKIEAVSEKKLLNTLPIELQNSFHNISFEKNTEEYSLIKAADKFSAYIKCLEENKTGNTDFKEAEKSILDSLNEMAKKAPEIKYFLKNFIPPYSLSIDKLNGK